MLNRNKEGGNSFRIFVLWGGRRKKEKAGRGIFWLWKRNQKKKKLHMIIKIFPYLFGVCIVIFDRVERFCL